MAKFRVKACGDLLVREPGDPAIKGQLPRYVGRKWVAPQGTEPGHWEPSGEPEYDDQTKDGARIRKLVLRDACLLPADPESAKVLGLAPARAPKDKKSKD